MAGKLKRHKYLLLAGALAMVILIAVAGTVLASDSSLVLGQANASTSQQTDKDFTIQTKRFSYDPSVITVHYGDRVTITLKSQDVEHGFYLDGYGIDVKFSPQNPQTVTFVADKVGTFKFRCSVPCGPFHPFMRGKLVVEPDPNFIPWAMVIGTVAVSAASVGGPAFLLWRRNKDNGSL